MVNMIKMIHKACIEQASNGGIERCRNMVRKPIGHLMDVVFDFVEAYNYIMYAELDPNKKRTKKPKNGTTTVRPHSSPNNVHGNDNGTTTINPHSGPNQPNNVHGNDNGTTTINPHSGPNQPNNVHGNDNGTTTLKPHYEQNSSSIEPNHVHDKDTTTTKKPQADESNSNHSKDNIPEPNEIHKEFDIKLIMHKTSQQHQGSN